MFPIEMQAKVYLHFVTEIFRYYPCLQTHIRLPKYRKFQADKENVNITKNPQ